MRMPVVPDTQNRKTLAPKAAASNNRQTVNTFFRPNRRAIIPIGIVPAMLPKASALAKAPNDLSLKPRSSIKRL